MSIPGMFQIYTRNVKVVYTSYTFLCLVDWNIPCIYQYFFNLLCSCHIKFVLCIWHCSILHGNSGLQCSTFPGCSDTDAAGFYSICEQPKKWPGISIRLLPTPPPFATWVSSTQAGGLDSQEFGGKVKSARPWTRVELWRPDPHSNSLSCFRQTGQ